MSSVPELGGELMERRRTLESEGETMSIELNAPQLLFTETISEVKKQYDFKTSEHPELQICRWLMITVNQPQVPSSDAPYMHLKINDKTITQVVSARKAVIFFADSTKGFWIGESASNDNNAYIIDTRGIIETKMSSNLTDFPKYEPIEKVSFWSYADILSAGTIIKVYGC